MSDKQEPSLQELREQVERQELLVRKRTLETAYNWYDDYVNPAEPLFDTPDFFFPLAGENLPFNLDNRQKGELLPVYITEYGLKILRDYSRWLAAFNPFALNALDNRVSYTVGTGFGYRAVPTRDDDVEAWRLCRQVQGVIDDFLERTDWGELEQEVLRRADRDGEAFLRFFPTGNGHCTVRTVEPEHVKSPGDQSAHFSFGVETPEHDVQDVLAFWIVEDPSVGWSPSRVPADEVVHIRLNVDRSAKRGYPTLIPVRRNLLRADKLLQNMSTLAQVQATFALIRKHKQYPASAVQSWQQSQADLAVGDPVSGNSRYLQRYLPGTILDVPDQTDYEFPAAKVPADSLVAVLQAELRAVAARLVLPEYMLTSNAENANYASTLVAEAPAVKHFQRLQRQLARAFGDGRYGGPRRCGALWRVLECAVRWGKIPKDVFRRVALHVEPPSPVARDRDKETARAASLNKAGVLSKATWSKWEGLDPARERRQIEREKQLEQPPAAGRDPLTETVQRLLEQCQPHKSGRFQGTNIGYDPERHNANCRLAPAGSGQLARQAGQQVPAENPRPDGDANPAAGDRPAAQPAADQTVVEHPSKDDSNLQWITRQKMQDLADHHLVHTFGEVNDYQPYRVLIAPYGTGVRAFVYTLDVNPAALGDRQWRLAAMYSFGLPPGATPQQLQTALAGIDTADVARRLVKATQDTGLAAANVAAMNSAILIINMLPGGATADALDRKDYVDATISFVGDVATLGSIWAAWKAGRALKAGQAALRANQALVRFQAIDGAIAVARTGQAGYAVIQGEDGKAAGYMGEALLRLFGIAYTRAKAPAVTKVPKGRVVLAMGPRTTTFHTWEVHLEGPLQKQAQSVVEKAANIAGIDTRRVRVGYSPNAATPVYEKMSDGKLALVLNKGSLTHKEQATKLLVALHELMHHQDIEKHGLEAMRKLAGKAPYEMDVEKRAFDLLKESYGKPLPEETVRFHSELVKHLSK
jgi:capsid protein